VKILHVVAPAPYGGLEQVVCDLAEGLAGHGEDVHVAAILGAHEVPGEHPFVRAIARLGTPLHVLQLPARGYLKERAALRTLYGGLAPDVVHTHGYRADVIAGMAARSLSIPTIATAHGFTGGDLRNRCYEILQRRAFRSCTAVIAVSRPLYQRLSRPANSGARVTLIQNAWAGGKPQLERAAARAALDLGFSTRLIGWIGRLSHEKGPDVLLEALPHLPGDCAVVFIGDGPERSRLAARARALCVGPRVHFAGRRPNAGSLMPAFDAYALSSRTEGTPLVLFEAMAAGVPVVATRVGGVPDVIDESCALLVPPEQPVQLARALQAALDDRDASAARAACAQQRLQIRFAVGDWIARHLELYRNVCHQLEAA
jgi:glycosyltransferase involved in cell wall biosynthesis